MRELQNYIEQEFKNLNRGIVATPQTREHLESFAKANNGSMDIVLMQMSINYGYKIALENFKEKIERRFTIMDRILIKDMVMSARLLNCLKSANINYLDELSEFTLYDISRWRKFGIKTISELQQIKDKYKFKFKDE
jgi:DNA-directed RNA polymerase alpha subunit